MGKISRIEGGALKGGKEELNKCLSLLFCCSDKHHDKKNQLGEGGAYLASRLQSNIKTLREVEAGTEGHGGLLLTALLPTPCCTVCFLI